jgi:membrane-bound serine protease (ClpP class)
VLTLVALVLAIFVLPAPWNIVIVLGAIVVDIAETAVFFAWSRRRRRLQPAAVGPEALLGRRAIVSKRLDPTGQVRVDGAIWAAHSSEPVDVGIGVVVRGVEGLTLDVEPPEGV